ncbi:DoxX family protein [Pseudomonas brassicacearum]|uniref:DoxX family protein n=1 Tax=Pseudomonas brassicacearum TaxID=930166 RepID=UPI000F4A651E|nr:DoxX family protein [Pseudomonas brassicacearum]
MSNKAFNQSNSTRTAFKYTSLGLRLVAALAFLAAGGAKLAGVPMMVEIFEHIGLSQWFRIATGLIEINEVAVASVVPSSTRCLPVLRLLDIAPHRGGHSYCF